MSTSAHTRWTKESCKYNAGHHRLRTVAALVNDLNPGTYVDLGCAGGFLSTLTPGSRYIGVDFVEPESPPAFEFYRCDLNADDLPEALGKAELVTCSGILEYIDDLPGFFAKLHGGTRPEAVAIVTYFNMNHISRICRLLLGGTIRNHPDWRNFLSPRDFQSLASAAGFSIARVLPIGLSLFGSPGVQDTSAQEVHLRRNFKGSYLLAHQFIYVLKKQHVSSCDYGVVLRRADGTFTSPPEHAP
jgi:methyltransferase family protein